ncbi:MAG: Ig-like domain-containing protein [Lachnospiraceae bacterium]|nr:Ig-like domain-containing protein [Lachnospiraceae bacterium]
MWLQQIPDTCSNPSVVTVYSNGLVYANSPGTATITATASDGSGIYTNCIVYVEQNHDNYDFGDDSGNDDRPNRYYGTLTASGIYCASTSPAIVAGMVTEKSNPSDVIEYRWIVCEEKDPNKWLEISPWKKNNEWLNWTPEKSGNYVIVGQARIVGKESSEVQASFGTPYHKNIKGICQMPYAFGGYLIGIESFDNPNNSYKYEMLILDCTLYAQGLPAWTYTTGKCYASGNCLWTVWQPEYGYYWTLFRIYDENDNLIDEACFGFENVN